MKYVIGVVLMIAGGIWLFGLVNYGLSGGFEGVPASWALAGIAIYGGLGTAAFVGGALLSQKRTAPKAKQDYPPVGIKHQ